MIMVKHENMISFLVRNKKKCSRLPFRETVLHKTPLHLPLTLDWWKTCALTCTWLEVVSCTLFSTRTLKSRSGEGEQKQSHAYVRATQANHQHFAYVWEQTYTGQKPKGAHTHDLTSVCVNSGKTV